MPSTRPDRKPGGGKLENSRNAGTLTVLARATTPACSGRAYRVTDSFTGKGASVASDRRALTGGKGGGHAGIAETRGLVCVWGDVNHCDSSFRFDSDLQIIRNASFLGNKNSRYFQ